MKVLLTRLRKHERGIAAVEYAIVAPAFLVVLMGGFDLGHTLYMEAVLQGTVQKAARDSSIETNGTAAQQTIIDTRVRNAVRDLNSSLTDNDIKITRTFYQNFTTAQSAQPEDANQNGICEPGEVWVDRNFNDVYDAKGGSNGQGGAKDVVVYSVNIEYPRLFPMAGLIGLPADVKLDATTVLANQPYGDQQTRTGSLSPRNCP